MSKSQQYAAMVNYFNSLLAPAEEVKEVPDLNKNQAELPEKAYEPELQKKVESSKPELKPYKDPENRSSLEALLEQVPVIPTTDVATATKTQIKTETLVKTENVAQVKTEVKVAPVVAKVEQTQAQVAPVQAPVKPQVTWKNIEPGKEFSALFFKVAGITLAVPLKYLGGIYEPQKITQLFGKPAWFTGITNIRQRKVAVVDTAGWLMPGKQVVEHQYRYCILLGNTDWAIQCDELVGTKNLLEDGIKWRKDAGARPWLAGIVKNDMCALLHPDELVKMLESGADVKDLIDGAGHLKQ